MATVTTAQLATKIDSLATAFQALVLQATTDNPPPRKVLVADVNNRQQLIEPERIFHMAEFRWTVPLVPNSTIPATICLFNAAHDGKLVQTILPGMPAAVASQLGLSCQAIQLAAPTVVTEAASAADASTAIAAIDGLRETDANGDVWTLSPAGETLKNGVSFAGGRGSKYALVAGTIYVLGLDNQWWAVAGDGWRSVGTLPTDG